MSLKFSRITFTCFCLLIMSGCSSLSPTLPQDDCPNMQSSGISMENPDSETGLLGTYLIDFDPETLEYEISPIRNAASQAALEIVDLTNNLTYAPCFDCVQIKSVAINSSNFIVFTIGIKHPFPKPNPAEPITARNRGDLHVFNIEGTLVFNDSVGTNNFPALGKSIGKVKLLNADGYSPYLDSSLDEIFPTTASIHPYKLHYADFTNGNFSATNPNGFADFVNPTGNLVMPMGAAMDYRDYIFSFAGTTGPVQFIYAIGCSYGVSASNKNDRMDPVYRVPQFNKKAASITWVWAIINDPPNGLVAGATGSSETLQIAVLDMNYNATVGSAIDQVLSESKVTSIEVEIPGVTNGKVVVTSPTPVSGDPRDKSNPMKFNVTVTNAMAASAGSYLGLAKVKDSYPVGSSPGLPMDGLKRLNPGQDITEGFFAIDEFATYTLFQVGVAENAAPTACFTKSPTFDPYPYMPVRFDASCSDDSDGSILSYEWDFEFNGTSFTPDATGVQVSHYYQTTGNRTVALRVRDNLNNPGGTTQSVNVIDPPVISVGANVKIIEDIDDEGIPVGLHYCDSRNDKVYVAVPSPNSPHSIMVARSDNGGDTFEGAVSISETGINYVDAVTVNMTPAGAVDIMWMDSMLWPAEVNHDRATNGYNFGTDSFLTLDTISENLASAVSGENTVFTTYAHVNIYTSEIDIFMQVSTDAGVTWGPYRNVTAGALADPDDDQWVSAVCADSSGNAYVAYVDDWNDVFYFTKTSDQGQTFEPWELLENTTVDDYYEDISMDISDDGQYIYIAYKWFFEDRMNIYCTMSDDGGDFFYPGVLVDDSNYNVTRPCLVLDPYDWGVYVIFEEQVCNGLLKLTRSVDHGQTFPTSILINDYSTTVTQKNPTVTVDEDLRIHMFWRDDREDEGNRFDLYYARAEQ